MPKIGGTLNFIASHNLHRKECLNLIASENIVSPLARAVLNSDLVNRYAIGSPKKRKYAGNQFYDLIETQALKLTRELLKARYANVQPVSGMVANLCAYNTLLKPGDSIFTLPVKYGGHYSHNLPGMLSLFQVKVLEVPFDKKNYNIDIQKTIKKLEKYKPAVLLLGTSEFLFPAPVRELKETCLKTKTKILYDASHVSGLIFGKNFQDPLKEGADLLSMSTNKTLSAPDHGILATKDLSLKKKLEESLVPMFTSNHHSHHIAALTVTLEEFKEFGKSYAKQMILNAQALAKRLFELEISVLGENLGFTKSHTVLIDVKKDANRVVTLLEKANLISNSFELPWDELEKPHGIRLGVNEITRLGMKEKEMIIIADFISQALQGNSTSLLKIKKEVMDFRKQFQKIHYCYEPQNFQTILAKINL